MLTLKIIVVYLKFHFSGLPYFYLLDPQPYQGRVDGRAITRCQVGRSEGLKDLRECHPQRV